MEQRSPALQGRVNTVTVECVAESCSDCMSDTCVGRSCVGPNRMFVRFLYAFLFLLTVFIAWIIRDYGSVALSELPCKTIFNSSTAPWLFPFHSRLSCLIQASVEVMILNCIIAILFSACFFSFHKLSVFPIFNLIAAFFLCTFFFLPI